MLLITITLKAGSGAENNNPDARVILDIVWTTAVRGDRMEHISAIAQSGRIDLGFYSRAQTELHAVESARRICQTATRLSPYLRGWKMEMNEPHIGGHERA